MAAVYIPLSKILDVWGRAEGFLLMATFATVGMAMMAASRNLATYCAANVSTPFQPLYLAGTYFAGHGDILCNDGLIEMIGVLASWLGWPDLQHRRYNR